MVQFFHYLHFSLEGFGFLLPTLLVIPLVKTFQFLDSNFNFLPVPQVDLTEITTPNLLNLNKPSWNCPEIAILNLLSNLVPRNDPSVSLLNLLFLSEVFVGIRVG